MAISMNQYLKNPQAPSVLSLSPFAKTNTNSPTNWAQVQNRTSKSSPNTSTPATASTATPTAMGSSLVSAYSAALDAQKAARQSAYDTASAQQKANYDMAVGQVNRAADNALQQAYINKMIANRTMNQELAAQGISGGMAETTRAGLMNNYSNSRLATEESRREQLANLANAYNNNMVALRNYFDTGNANDLTAYTTNLANLAAQNGVQNINFSQLNGTQVPNQNLYYEYLQQLLGMN